MHGNAADIENLLGAILEGLTDLPSVQSDVLVFPPYVYLPQVMETLQGTTVKVGAQDVDHRENGAVTGGVSASMLQDLGCRYVIVGHSERRSLFGETDPIVAAKFRQSLAAGLTPIVCVGESLDQRNAGSTLEVVNEQLRAVLDTVDPGVFRQAMVAYEPVWAIGTGESASPAQAEAVHLALRNCIREFDAEVSAGVRILYGGSVSPENAPALFAEENIDGALVGGASLEGSSFTRICEAADKSLDS